MYNSWLHPLSRPIAFRAHVEAIVDAQLGHTLDKELDRSM
jgi:hypothetical protein